MRAQRAVPRSRWVGWIMPLTLPLLGLGWSPPVIAQATQAQPTPSVFTEDDPTAWREHRRAESARWQLTEAEYARYLELMKGPRGAFSVPNITPIEVLGIHAETAAERQKYASRWVELIKADTARVLAFQNAVHVVWTQRYPHEPMVNRRRINQLRVASDSRFGPLKAPRALMSLAGRTLFFTRPECRLCDQQLEVALNRLDAGTIAGLDIYLGGVPPGDDAVIQTWARERGLPIERLTERSITLNYDVGVSTRVARQVGRTPSVPMAVQRRGEAYEWVALDQL